MHTAAWTGLRSAEPAGLQIADVELPTNSNKPGALRVDRTVARVGTELRYLTPKTKGSRRRVPMTPATTVLLRDYLREHPCADEPTGPLFPAVRLVPPRPTGKRAETPDADAKARAARQTDALAALSVSEHEKRLVLDWTAPLRHATYSKAVFRPAVLRARRLSPHAAPSPDFTPHGLRHTYASLMIAAGRPTLEISRFMGHSKVTTTLSVYTHLFDTDDHADAMAALAELAAPAAPNVVPLRANCQ
ncbi:tyrosine-type recombinase/integrase [Mycolicibacterium poriferae]|uniref:tyrosine-type recombinase/integrase n=1 Tax=Mycolicibacterium poriferae TaxID=39694 RepID=UPI001F1744DA|nr:tyrosine-type recombinase/integrase [Mycolicibacterium poriferae]